MSYMYIKLYNEILLSIVSNNIYIKMGFHEFSRNWKKVTEEFPWSLGTEPKNCDKIWNPRTW